MSMTKEEIANQEACKVKLEKINKGSTILFMAAREMCHDDHDASVLLSMLTASLSRCVIEVIADTMKKEEFEIFITEYLGKVKENFIAAFLEIQEAKNPKKPKVEKKKATKAPKVKK